MKAVDPREYIENDSEIQAIFRMGAEIGFLYETLLKKGIVTVDDLSGHDEIINDVVKRLTEEAIQDLINKEEKKDEKI